jgi:hypothetical protein
VHTPAGDFAKIKNCEWKNKKPIYDHAHFVICHLKRENEVSCDEHSFFLFWEFKTFFVKIIVNWRLSFERKSSLKHMLKKIAFI